MDEHKRQLIKTLVGTAVLGLFAPIASAAQQAAPQQYPAAQPFPPTGGASAQASASIASPINVIVPDNYVPPVDGLQARNYQASLSRAVMDFIEQSYRDRPLPAWERSLPEVDLERRVTNIASWVVQAVRTSLATYPVDPAWIMAQIMAESCFYEYAISSSFAVGVCQFIAPTARSYGMICAGDRPEHSGPAYRLGEYASRLEVYNDIRARRKNVLRDAYGTKSVEDHLKEALTALVRGGRKLDAAKILDNLALADQLNEDAKQAKALFKQYLQSNFEGRSIFNDRDLAFLQGFDERVTYKKPIASMIAMMAKALKTRNGNIIAAAAGYNAGLGNTHETGIYEPYGTLPNIGETVTYVSRIFINHHEIVRRMSWASWAPA